MIFIVILALALLVVIGNHLYDSSYGMSEDIGVGMVIVGTIATGVAIIVAIVLAITVSKSGVIDDRIDMYLQENTKIEEQVAIVINEYKDYESTTFAKLTPESAITLATIYPELGTNDLVQSQIAIYVQNNEKIKALKEEKICTSVYRWWLYFGK